MNDIKEINDYDMIRNSGLGVVMGYGSEKTKGVADVITDDNDHDGIGNFLEKYFKQKGEPITVIAFTKRTRKGNR